MFGFPFNVSVLSSALSVFSPSTHPQEQIETATFAGGCFWCMEHPFEELEGVLDVTSGYTGGTTENPTYHEVCSGNSGHLEAVQIRFDPRKISYEVLLHTFWRQVNPTDEGGQFVDRGTQYGTAIFFHNKDQKRQAEQSKEQLDASDRFRKKIVTEILPAESFYPAEDYHQSYHKKCPVHYQQYRVGSGRDRILEQIWGPGETSAEKTANQAETHFKKPTQQELRTILTPLQYKVTQDNGTEAPFSNDFWDTKTEGLYVDIVSGEPLFSSNDKFDSGTGWPSFTKPLAADNVKEFEDHTLSMKRTEVRSVYADSHLGHVFDDGPEPTGKRYCLNSAALRFIAKEKLEEEGYEEYLVLFKR